MPATRGSDSAAALVLRCAVGSRALTVALGLICDALVQDYDTSDHLLPAAPFAGLAHWDSVYYLHLADTLVRPCDQLGIGWGSLKAGLYQNGGQPEEEGGSPPPPPRTRISWWEIMESTKGNIDFAIFGIQSVVF